MAGSNGRRQAAHRLRQHGVALAASITEEFLRRHPDWLERYGELARIRGVEDARFHVEFLTGALLSGEAAAFEDYALWTSRVLASRGIDPAQLIENLEQVRDEAGRLLDDEWRAEVERLVAAGVQSILRGAPSRPASEEPLDRLGTERRTYLQALLAGERRAALTVALETLRAGASVPDIYLHVLQPAQYDVGRLWERNEISVAREHTATAITQFVIAHLYEHLPVPETMRGNAVVTGVRGELHQVGANMVADVLEADGWRMRFLGTQLPHADILRAIEAHEPQLLGISATVLSNLPAVSDLIEEVRRDFAAEVRIVVGGGAFRADPELWRRLGADGFGRDLRSARDVADALLPRNGG